MLGDTRTRQCFFYAAWVSGCACFFHLPHRTVAWAVKRPHKTPSPQQTPCDAPSLMRSYSLSTLVSAFTTESTTLCSFSNTAEAPLSHAPTRCTRDRRIVFLLRLRLPSYTLQREHGREYSPISGWYVVKEENSGAHRGKVGGYRAERNNLR